MTTGVSRGYTRCRFGQLHYHESRPQQLATAQPALLLLHQNPSAAMEYDSLQRELARDRHVIAFDTPGYGMSDPPPEPLSIAAYTAAFGDAIDALQLAATQPLDVFGFHTGALLAAELALQRPRSVRRLILSGIPLRTAAERAARLSEARATPLPTEDGAEVLARSAALWRFVVTARTPGVSLERAVQVYAEKNRTLHRGWWAYEGVWTYDIRGRLPKITQPTLVLQPHDFLLEQSRAACAMIPGAIFGELPDLDRDIFEIGVAPIANAIRKFLN